MASSPPIHMPGTGHWYDSQAPEWEWAEAGGKDIVREADRNHTRKVIGKTPAEKYRDLSDQHTFQPLSQEWAWEENRVRGKKDKVWEPTEKYRKIESRFIDEMYGSNPEDDRSNPDASPEGAIAKKEATDLWGLDLARDWSDNALNNYFTTEEGTTLTKGDLTSDQFYEYATRGTVDWAHYQDDPNWKKQYSKFQMNGGKDAGGDPNKIDTPEDVRRVVANTDIEDHLIGIPQGKEPPWESDDWKFEYDPAAIELKDGELYRDGVRQQTITDKLKIPMGEEGSAYLDVGHSKVGNEIWTGQEGSVTIGRTLGYGATDDVPEQTPRHTIQVPKIAEKKQTYTKPVMGINQVSKRTAPKISPVAA